MAKATETEMEMAKATETEMAKAMETVTVTETEMAMARETATERARVTQKINRLRKNRTRKRSTNVSMAGRTKIRRHPSDSRITIWAKCANASRTGEIKLSKLEIKRRRLQTF